MQIAEAFDKKRVSDATREAQDALGAQQLPPPSVLAPMLASTSSSAAHARILLASKSELVDDYLPQDLILMSLCNHRTLVSDLSNVSLPPTILAILDEYADVFPDDIPHGLPPLRGIERQIDLIPGATFPN